MQEPLSISRFIAVVTESPLEQDAIRKWFRCVRDHGPTGITLNLPMADDKGMPQTVCLVHRERNGEHRYIVPLARDLEEDEAGQIVDEFIDLHPELDFDIESSASWDKERQHEVPVISLDQQRYLDLCTAWAKRQHDMWLKDRTDNGWRYGTEMSITKKTNPLLMPWEQLPEKYRQPDLEEPQALLDLLNNQGYTVITKSELQAMLDLMRGGSSTTES